MWARLAQERLRGVINQIGAAFLYDECGKAFCDLIDPREFQGRKAEIKKWLALSHRIISRLTPFPDSLPEITIIWKDLPKKRLLRVLK